MIDNLMNQLEEINIMSDIAQNEPKNINTIMCMLKEITTLDPIRDSEITRHVLAQIRDMIDPMISTCDNPNNESESHTNQNIGNQNIGYNDIYKTITSEHNKKIQLTSGFIKFFLKDVIENVKKYNNNERPPKNINIEEITTNLLQGLPETMDTDNFYNYVADFLIAKSSIHYYYDSMAAYIAMRRIHNITSDSFLITAKLLQNNIDVNGERMMMLSDDVYDVIINNHHRLQSEIDYSRDFTFDYFGIKTLERSYLYKLQYSQYKIIERPQHLWMRVSIGIHGKDIESAIETYHLLSQKYFTHATPTLFNGGGRRPQMSSCFLQSVDDNIGSIFETVKEIAFTSKWSGGIGVHISSLRARGSLIRGTNGVSSGVVPFCILLNKLAKYINQGGKRNGSIAVYIEPYHADIYDFCDLRKNTGNDDNRARDLFLALWVPSLFIKRVKEDGMWSLMCPDMCPGLNLVHSEEFNKLYEKYESEKKYLKQVKARDLWKHILETQSETGFPYVLYKDHANAKSNQKNLGTIRSSNLCAEIIQYSDENETATCFTADTEIITKHGIRKIVNCDQQEVLSYFNNDISLQHDEHYEKAKLINNGIKTVYELKTQGNKPMKVTACHPILVRTKINFNMKKNTYVWKKVSDLASGDMVYTPSIEPINEFDINISQNLDNEWLTGGWMLGDGWMSANEKDDCFGPSEAQTQEIVVQQLNKWREMCHVKEDIQPNSVTNWQSSKHHFKEFLINKFGIKQSIGSTKIVSDKVKYESSATQIANFLSGLFSADGCVIYSNDKKLYVSLISASEKLLYDVQSLLIPFGIKSSVSFGKVRTCETSQGRLSIFGSKYLERYMKSIGFKLCPCKETEYEEKLKIKNANKTQYSHDSYQDCSKVISTKEIGEELVYDIALPISHNFIADGHIVHNCNLSSICLPKYIVTHRGVKVFEHKKLIQVIRVIVRNLDKIIDRNYYPTIKTKRSNMRHRPMGIGVQGLADVYNIMGISFDSPKAYRLNKEIFETIYYACIDESKELAKKFGPYQTFKGSPASMGQLQFHMWGIQNDELLMKYDWNKLVQEVKVYGLRNSLLTALMPTASTSQIMGNSECIEPYMKNIFKRSTLAGEFIVVNKNLMKDLIDLKLWNDDMRKRLIIEDGSVQNIDSIPDHIKEVYKTAFEIKQMHLVRQSADRGCFVDQSQSFNLFMKEPNFDILTSALIESHDLGNKTGIYYYRSSPAVNPINFGIDVDDIQRLTGKTNIIEMIQDSYDIESENNTVDHKEKDQCQKTYIIKKKLAQSESNVESDEVKMCKWKPGMKLEDCLECGS